jgi:hypothetical protein
MSSRFKTLARAVLLCASSARNAKIRIGSKNVRVFISHSDEDRLLANQIATRLKRAGNHVWFDESEIDAGDNVLLKIGEALDSSDAMVVIVSPAAGNSRVVREEVSYAIASEKFRNRLIPVIVKPTSKMPWILKKLNPEKGDPAEVSKRIIQRLKMTEA